MKPILFSPQMVQALLDRRKIQTRRTNGLKGLENHELSRLVWGAVCAGDILCWISAG